jgi:hypothetical protein
MYEALHRLALAAAVAVGAATLLALGELPGHTLADQHRLAMLGLVAASLVLTPWVPSLRLAAIAAGVATKLALLALSWHVGGFAALAPAAGEALQLLALMAAGAVLLLEARLEARWDGVLPFRQEG